MSAGQRVTRWPLLRIVLWAAVICLSARLASPLAAQIRAIKALAPAVAPTPRPRAADQSDDDAPDLSEKEYAGGAALKTDPEQQRLLKRAEQCVADGRLDLAAVLWQRVLDEAGDTLMTRDGRTYTSLADEVERTLAAGDPRGLATYRIQADGEAQAILAQAASEYDEEALAKVVRKYFLSSVGDDAAYKLACFALDRHDFVGASRLLTRILERHPDPSMPKSEILLRLAVASAHIGDNATGSAAIDAIGKIPGPRPDSQVLDDVAQYLTSAGKSSLLASAGSENWPMALGNPTRTGAMKSLPADATSRTLSELWVQEEQMQVAQSNTPNQYGMMGGGGFIRSGRMSPQPQNRAQAVSHDELVEQWREHKWVPTPMLLFDGGRVYFKTHDRLQCFLASAISNKEVWKSAWFNQYALDGMSSQVEMMVRAYGGRIQLNDDKPRGLAEIYLFGDRVHQQMSIAGGVIYSIEGERIMNSSSPSKPENQRPFQWGVQPRRTRSNFLAAYEARTGKALWHRAASDEDKEGSQDVGFLCAPVPYSNLLLTAVTDGGTIWIYGLNAVDGSTAWKSYLCDEPQNECKPWAPAGIAVEGREAYVACGTGAVFALDAVSGAIRWAVRYKRAEQGVNAQVNMWYGAQQRRTVAGWDDDVVIPIGRTLLVMASDSDQIFALDRRSGKALWNSPRTPNGMQEATYCLGVTGQTLFLGGRNVVRCYDVAKDGKLVWDHEIGDSLGRGCLTGDAVYVPVKDSIVKLDLEKGRELIQVGVALTSGDPVGNLFSDGEKLWVTGGGRVYAMTNLEHRLARLAEQIDAGDGEAQLNRMRLYAKAGEQELMLADLQGAYERFRETHSADEAAEKFLAAITELKLPQEQPAIVLNLLVEQFIAAPTPPQLTSSAARRADVAATALSAIRRKKIKGLTAQILALAPLCDKDYLRSMAAQAISATASGPEDAAALKAAIAGEDATAQFIAAGPLGRLAPAEAKEPLARLLDSRFDHVKLAAARGLADLGDRKMLPVLLSLLDSSDARVRQYSHETLRALSGQPIAFASEGTPEDRAKTVALWSQWISKEGEKSDLKTPLPDLLVRLGRTLIASQGQSTVIELDADFKVTSTIRVENPWGVWGLPNGNRLVAVYNQNKVVEYNEAGKEVWSKEGLPSPPYSVQRLENGNTLISCADVNQILDVSPDGSAKTFTGPWNRNARPVFARRLENGHTLVALQAEHRVVELDRSNKVIFEVRDVNGASSASRLDNGNTLIVQLLANRDQVIEVDSKGKRTSWSVKIQLHNPTDAQRLPSGNTLISDVMGLHEVDSAGNQVREFRHAQISSLSSY